MPPAAFLVAGAAGKAVSGILQAKAAKNSEEERRKLYNQYLQSDDAARKKIEQDMIDAGWNPAAVNELRSTATRQETSTVSGMREQQYKGFDPGFDKMMGGLLKAELAKPQMVTEAEKMGQLGNIQAAFDPQLAAERNAVARVGGTNIAQAGGVGSPAAREAIRARLNYLASLPETEIERRRKAREEGEAFMRARAGSKERYNETRNTFGSSNEMRQVAPDIQSLMSLRLPRGPEAGMNTGISMGGQLAGGIGDMLSAAGMWRAGQPTSSSGYPPSPSTGGFTTGPPIGGLINPLTGRPYGQ